jgi:hypothetical protein
MKQFISLLVLVVLIFSCQTSVNVSPKKDTGIISYWPSSKIPPAMYRATWTTFSHMAPSKTDSTRNVLTVDTAFVVKLADTTSNGKGGQILDTLHHPIPVWYTVPDSLKSYIHIIPKPNR